nr:hypothetical protein B0A51_19023 [Rachicladosporium sp. CCFEE 5018]
MTLGSRPAPPAHNHTSRAYFEHATAPRINTDAVLVTALRAEYPNLHLTVVPHTSIDLFGYARAGNAGLAAIDSEKDRLTWRRFISPATRLDGDTGDLGTELKFGKFLLDWHNTEYIVHIADCRDGSSAYPSLVNQYVLSPSVATTNVLLLEAGKWTSTLHAEIWVFDGGYWQKSRELYESIVKASWDDVILDPAMKKSLQADVKNFFASRETYAKLKVPWKRGIIYYGPPGNGKTISVKATMNLLYKRSPPIPTLYVRSLSSFAGPEYSIKQIFGLARRTAPCYLVFEDLDSLVTPFVRSYFLNEVDGIRKNEGILMLGSTNHLDLLDPGIAKRPSRFDRKYLFNNPNADEREQYAKFWQKKLADNKDVDFPDRLCPAIAGITKDFSFAYIQEAMVASLLALARESDEKNEEWYCLRCMENFATSKRVAHETGCAKGRETSWDVSMWIIAIQRVEDGDKELEKLALWRQIRKQVRILREELDAGNGETAEIR